jgi:Tol biopolymer transport system component
MNMVQSMPGFMLTSPLVLRMTRFALGTALATSLALFAATPASRAASFPTEYRFRSLRAKRVTIHFHQGLETQARQAAALADAILARYEARYDYHIGRVQIVLSDEDDDANGFTTPLPYPLVQLRAAAPDGSDEFGNLEDWLQVLLTHELAHSIHLEQGRGLVRVGRAIFGRAPFLFPNADAPTWMVEGLATYEETANTSFGRGRNPDSLMVRRMAALEGDFPEEDRATGGLQRWPQGQAPYLFGEGFLRYLTRRFGEETLPRLAEVQSRWPLPFLDELTSQRVTGATFHARWSEYAAAERESATAFAAERRAQGLTVSCALTEHGIMQTAPRFSPDGRQLAFTSSSLTRQREIHILSLADGRERSVVDRHGGSVVSWTPDGKQLVYDDPDVYRLYANRYDLWRVDIASGRRQRLTRGMRARDPDVSPDGRRVVFVRRYTDRSELALVDIDGGHARDLTTSAPGTQWSDPRFRGDGQRIVAARWTEGGWLDLATVDPEGKAPPEELTRDRARDVEPTWTPDGRHVVFRSDRDGASNIYALRVDDNALLRVTNVLGGAFAPTVAPDGHTLAFADYSARGYDLHEMDVDWTALTPAAPFVDHYPEEHPLPEPATGETRTYHPFPVALPRYWTPYVISTGTAGEIRYGATTGGSDPLGQHTWALDIYRGSESKLVGGSGYYVYDRFRPQLVLALTDDVANPRTEATRQREVQVSVNFPLARTRHWEQDLSVGWRRSHDELPQTRTQDFGGVVLGWSLSHDVQSFPYSISPSQGEIFQVTAVKEDPALGSEVALVKVVADATAYRRLLGENDILVMRLGGGATLGEPAFQHTFAVGGFPGGTVSDIPRTNQSVLRGYDDDVFTGRNMVHGNLEYRFPLAHPQRGIWSAPIFLRHLHAAVFTDAANAFSGPLRLRDIRTSAGGALGADLFVGHAIPLTATVGVARGLSREGRTLGYLRMGLSF